LPASSTTSSTTSGPIFIEAPEGEPHCEVQYLHDAPGYARALAWAFSKARTSICCSRTRKPMVSRPTRRKSPAPWETHDRRGHRLRVVAASFLVLAMGWDLYEPTSCASLGWRGRQGRLERPPHPDGGCLALPGGPEPS
jgi:hypothetical protein